MSKSGDDDRKSPELSAEETNIRAIRNEHKVIQLRRKDRENPHKQQSGVEAAPDDFDPDPTAA